jgi:hypothetical protein
MVDPQRQRLLREITGKPSPSAQPITAHLGDGLSGLAAATA